MLRPLFYALVAHAALLAGVARAQPVPAEPGFATYAIVVGNNAGGPGQTDLRYAEDDARRMAGVLTELGGYAPESVDVIVHPTPDIVRQHLEQLSLRVHADLAAGKQARVFFYYSGHARATALDLGASELPLTELRTRLFSVPATLTVVVLDACQSGAFSRVKGAAPAADFSFNSRQHLDASGIAVLASSSGSELSQESEQLHSSYFTHHLLIGLRGAGDANHDGQVTIDEAYRYAYHQTLLDTTQTAVGGQHVTFEVDLKGHGEVPMSFPRTATASIELPAALEGKTLVHDKRAHTVIAETYKAKGAAVRIAVAAGDYQVLVRHGGTLSRCDVTTGPGGGVVDLDRCTHEAVVESRSKGGDADDGDNLPIGPRWRIDVVGLFGAERKDDYTTTLENFGYHEQGLLPLTKAVRATAWWAWRADLAFGASLEYAAAPAWRRADHDTGLQVSWSTISALAGGRVDSPTFGDSGFFSRFNVYTVAGVGPALVRETFTNELEHMTTTTNHPGLALAAEFGLHGKSPLLDGLGVDIAFGVDATIALKNDIGDRHTSGGYRCVFGFTYAP